MPPRYRYPARIASAVVVDFFLGRKRSFAQDAARLREGISRLRISGGPPSGSRPYLFLVNHYSRPGFRAWWIPIALVSASGPPFPSHPPHPPHPPLSPLREDRREMHWPMTSAWTYPDALRARFVTPLTEWALARFARMYGFTLMPPMPPRERDIAARAASVRRMLRIARGEKPSIGMAPEGMDSPDGRLMEPPPGAGRFIALLADAGYTPVPVGAYEERDAFCLRFGEPFALPRTAERDPDTRDREIRSFVMKKIGELLPDSLTPGPSPGTRRQ